VSKLLGDTCGTGTCHNGTAHVDLRNTAGLYDRIVGAMPNGPMTMTACKSKKLVVANDTTNSVLSNIVKGAVSGCSTARMPDDCSTSSTNPRACWTTTQIQTLDSWIMSGAPM
jgi:hypothetical protein